MKSFNITTVARLVGVSTSTLRRWQREGLVSFVPNRDAVGRRIYSDVQVRELHVVFARLRAETVPIGGMQSCSE